jgi:enoyl-CoA hydratase/carnithine racemase
MSNLVTTERDGRIMVVTMNRPEKKNALTHAMYSAMADALDAAAADADVRAVLLAGAGDSFSAGNDMVDFQNPPPGDGERPVARFLRTLLHFRKPVVAAVQGAAVGVGTTLLLHCDLVVVAHSAKLQVPFVNLALVPEFASSLLLPRRVGEALANDMFLTGRALSGSEALAAGIASRLVSDAELAATARAAAHDIAAKAPTAVQITKQLVRGDVASLAARMAEEGAHFAAQLKSAEFMEAATAFLQKRAPDFG